MILLALLSIYVVISSSGIIALCNRRRDVGKIKVKTYDNLIRVGKHPERIK